MKTKEGLNALKEEVDTLNKKLAELNEEELEQVAGGTGEMPSFPCPDCGTPIVPVTVKNGRTTVVVVCPSCGKDMSFELSDFSKHIEELC